MATPLEISIALHYHTSPFDYRGGDFSAPAVREAIDRFERAQLLTLQPGAQDSCLATEGLKLWVEALCRVPFPVQKWVIPLSEPAGD